MSQRKTYLVQKGFQRKMIINVILLVVLATAITNAIVYGIVAYQQTVTNADLFVVTKDYIPEGDLPVITRLDIVKPAIISSLLITDVVGVVIISIFMLIYSNRIAGPVYRMKMRLEQLRDGNLDIAVKLRPKDEFKGLADAFNEAVASLRARVIRIKEGKEDINSFRV